MLKCLKRIGWGTWIRTRTNGVRVRGSTVNLFPNATGMCARRADVGPPFTGGAALVKPLYAAGTIRSVRTRRLQAPSSMEPCLEPPSDACARYAPAEPYLWALELPFGGLAEFDLGPGASLAVRPSGPMLPRPPSAHG